MSIVITGQQQGLSDAQIIANLNEILAGDINATNSAIIDEL